jgi:molecular chaperone GrpE
MPDEHETPAADGPVNPDRTSYDSDEVSKLIAERDDFREKWIRTSADLENYRRRMQRDLADQRKYESLPLLKAMLPALDNLDRAIHAASTNSNIEELVAGLGMVVKQFETALASVGATPIVAVGQAFDPNRHEALTQMPSADHPPMTVLQEVERGYELADRVVRPSKVVVSRAADV